MSRKNRQLVGYRIHRERILFSGGTVTRSIRFPLQPWQETPETKQIKRRFEQAVIADDLKVRGDLNLPDFLVYTQQGKSPYTLADFWVDSLRAGVVWADGSAQLVDLIANLYTGENRIYRKIFVSIPEEFRRHFETEKFIEKLIGKYPEIMRKTTREKFRNLLIDTLKDQDSKKGQELIEKIISSIFKDGVPSKEDQLRFMLRFLGGDYSYIETLNPGRLTFFIIPQLKNASAELEQLIKERESFFRTKNLKLKFLLALGLANRDVDYEDLIRRNRNLPQTKFNGFFNYFNRIFQLLLKQDVNQIFELLLKVYPPLGERVNKEKAEIVDSLQFLSKRAQRLGQPQLLGVSGWHDYRSVFGGKIQSWFSNLMRREKELGGQIEKFKDSLKTAQDYLNSNSFPEEAKEELEEIRTHFDRLEELISSKNLKASAEYQTFDVLLSALKRRLNFFYQIYIREEDDDTPVTKFKKLKGLYERIYKPMSFFGKAQRRINEKIVNQTIPIIENGIKIVFALKNSLKDDFSPRETFKKVKRKREKEQDVIRRQLEFLWRKYKDKAVNSSVFRRKYTKVLQSALANKTDWKEMDKNKTRYIFYRSPYAKGTLEEVKLKDESLEFFEKIFLNLFDFASQFDKSKLLADKKILIDWVELSRNLISSLIRFSRKEEFDVEDLKIENFEIAKNYRRLFSLETAGKNEFTFLIQSLIFSELKGAATVFSKEKYLARYTAQVVGADGRYKLFYSSKGRKIKPDVANKEVVSEERKDLVINPHQYLIALDSANFKKLSGEDVVYLNLKKKKLTPGKIKAEQEKNLFCLTSSPYQLQFLDKFIFRPKGWEEVNISLGEWMFVVECYYEADWDLASKKPTFKLISDSKKNKLYVAIPFQLSSKAKPSPLAKLGQKDSKRADLPILGIDVGEYGLAWVLADFKNGKPKIIDKGFIENKNIANIKDKFAEIQQRARTGIFDEKSSLVARIRENAVGALRNRVHLVLTQKTASVIYEASITNFETGSGRVTRIYDSVKRADAPDFKIQAHRLVHNHIWGRGAKMVGKNLSAYASSYTCSKCWHSLYQIQEKDLEKIEVVEREGNIITFTTPYGKINAYSKNKRYQKGFRFIQEGESSSKDKREKYLKELRKIVRDFTRPPVDKKSEVLAEFARNIPAQVLESFKNRRGNSSIFVCPFCHHLADADIQAALIIAIRGYLNYTGLVKSGEKSGKSYLEQTVELLHSFPASERPVIGLNLSAKF